MANGYGEWMNNLSGMTSALDAASPYAQQLAAQNAAQMAVASQIRSGLPQFGFGQGYGYQPPTGTPPVVGGTYQVLPQPTPFTGFADLIAANRAARLSPQPYPNPPAISGGVAGTGEQRDEGPSLAPYESGDRTLKEWWDVMKGLPGFVGQFTLGGIANQVYQQEFGFKPTTTWDATTTGYGPWEGRAPTPPAGMVEILSRSPNAIPPGVTAPIPEVDIEQLGLLYEPSPIPIDEVYQQWLSDQINAGAAQEESGPQWWEQPQSEEEY